MNLLTKSLISELVGDNIVTALYGGGFKPPTKGHFEVVQKALTEFPEIDKFIVYVGSGERNGITQAESLLIWEIYKKYLGDKVEIQPSKSPIGDIIRYGKSHPEEVVYFVIGARDGNEGDLQDVALRTLGVEDKYPNVKIKVIQTPDAGISGTKAREASKISPEAFYKFLPSVINDNERLEIFGYIQDVVTEKQLNEVGEANIKPYKWEEIDREGYFVYTRFLTDSETKYDVDLKTTTYIDNDQNNLRALEIEFTAKPKGAEGSSAKIIVNKGEMYKVMSTIVDIVKKYIKKSKTQAILYSPSKKGNEEFGSQRDNLYKAFISKAIPGVRFEKDGEIISAIIPNTINEIVTATEVICDNCGWEWPIADGGDDLYICHKCGHDNNPDLEEASDPEAGTALPYGSGFAPIKENASYSKDINVKEKILELTKHMLAKGMNIKPLPKVKFVNGDSNNAREFLGKTAYYDPNNFTITLYTEGRHPKDIVRSFSHEMIHHTQNLEDRLGDVSTTNTMEDDNIDKLEQEANLKGTMTFRNWTDSLNESLEEATQYIWKHREDILSLPMMENKKKVINELNEQLPQIYCDMDGVLVDFDKQFEKASGGIPPREYEDKNGKEAFWNVINEKGVGFWVGMPWMVNGKQLWDHIKPYNPKLLSAPSRSNESRLGKRLWVKNNIPGTELILAYAENKKNYADGNNILIDDRPSNIDQWKAAGGIGILFISTEQTIKELSKYGL